MAFSFRNLFKKEEETEGDPNTAQHPQRDLNIFGGRDPVAANQPESSPFAAAPQNQPPALPVVVPAFQIIPLIPQELVNPNGLAPDAMVRLPAASPSGGLKLTEVYQACPALFSYAPDMRDNREIVVGVHAAASPNPQPLQSPFAVEEPQQPQHQEQQQQTASSPFAPTGQAFDEGGSSPAWQVPNAPENAAPQYQQQQQQAPDGGFLPQNQLPGFETGSLPPQNPHQNSPFESGSLPASQQPQQVPPTDNQPALFHPPTDQLAENPARPATQELDASALPFAPAPPQEPAEETGEIELSLLNLLRGVSQEDLGFDPEEVPPDVRTLLPLALIRPQLSSGHVVVPLDEIIVGCEERFHRAFANSREGVQVPLPLQEIFHNLPGDTPEGPSTAEMIARQQAEGAPIYDPTAPAYSPAESEPETVAQPDSNAGWETQQPAQAPPAETYAAAPQQTEQPAHGHPDPSPFFAAEPEPQAPAPYRPTGFETQGGLSSEQLLGAPFEPIHDPSPNESASPEAFPALAPDPAHEPASSPHASGQEPSADFAEFDQQTDLDQLALRAIFQIEGRLSAQGVLDLCCGLQGVGACVALHPGGALSAGDLGSGFGEDAAGMFQNVAGLARGLGIGEADTFTIRTRKGTFSFFSQGDLCLGVLHDPGQPQFGPGTREKLVLVARELGGMTPG